MQHETRRFRPAVSSIADHRMADRGEMDSNLMHPASPDLRFNQTIVARPHNGQRLFSADRRLDRDLVLNRACDLREVGLADLAAREQTGKRSRSVARAREHDQTARPGVESMHEEERSILHAKHLLERALLPIA